MTEPTLTRHHRSRLMQIWRSAGWPCRDGIELDLLAAQLIELQIAADGRETLRLTEAGIRQLAEARRRGARALSAHDRLAHKFAAQLLDSGRLVWRELSLRAQVDDATAPAPAGLAEARAPALWQDPTPELAATSAATSAATPAAAPPAAHVWRMARPDLFSLRPSSVEAYLQPMVHEIKFSRADLLSDLRHAAKRQAYEWLCSEVYYVFPVAVARPNEIPEQFGIWVLHGGLDDGHFELLRPARHQRCTLPFAVWLALAKATPLRREDVGCEDSPQAALGAAPADAPQRDAA
ncbi:MAG: hypothetical protein ABW005_12495 [Burkholderiaceae bacterium]